MMKFCIKKGIVAMEVHQDGFCQNNEPQNKRPTPVTYTESAPRRKLDGGRGHL